MSARLEGCRRVAGSFELNCHSVLKIEEYCARLDGLIDEKQQ